MSLITAGGIVGLMVVGLTWLAGWHEPSFVRFVIAAALGGDAGALGGMVLAADEPSDVIV